MAIHLKMLNVFIVDKRVGFNPPKGERMNWKDKTCEKCEYRDLYGCRRFPPSQSGYFPLIRRTNEFSSACAEYKEIQK
jgi:hypothetical protein